MGFPSRPHRGTASQPFLGAPGARNSVHGRRSSGKSRLTWIGSRVRDKSDRRRRAVAQDRALPLGS
jgi:hypothetical protein